MKQELAEASQKATAFKQSLKGRVLSIKLSDSSDAPEPNIPKPSCAAEPSDAAKPSDSGVSPPSLVESAASHAMPHHHVPQEDEMDVASPQDELEEELEALMDESDM